MHDAFAKLKYGLGDGDLEGAGELGEIHEISIAGAFAAILGMRRYASANGLDSFYLEDQLSL